MLKRLRKLFKRDEKGQGIVEFGLILALVSVVAIGSLSGLGDSVSEKFDEVVGVMSGSEIAKSEPVYSEEEIDRKITNQGYIPISTPEELDALRNGKGQTFGKDTKWEGEYTSGLDKKYIQVADINLSRIDNFKPIGTLNDKFTGEFDGGGYTINNLTIDRGEENHVGLFGYAVGPALTNISLVNVDVKGDQHVGGLVGFQNSTSVSNSYATGQVTGNRMVGGLVGTNFYDTVHNSYAEVKVTGNSYIGGLIGESQMSGIVSSSYATGQVTGASDVGGLVGGQDGSSSVSHSYATGKVTGDGRVGGLVGRQHKSSVSNSYATGQVIGKNIVGGLSGYLDESTVSSSYATGQVVGESYVGGLVGRLTTDERYKSGVYYSGWASDVNTLGIGIRGGNIRSVTGQSKSEIEEKIKEMNI